ncbi:hypothetical protein JCM1841_000526 [Sporobolomyces salmonicolor]
MADPEPQAAPNFIRATARRAGQLVLYPAKLAIDRAPLPAAVRRNLPGVLRSGTGASGLGGFTVEQPGMGGAPLEATTSPSSAGPSAPSPFSLPSPVTYLTSAYLVTSLVLAFLLHRIHHLVPPSHRHANAAQPHPHHQRGMNRVMRPAVQLGMRAPGLLMMLKTIVGLVLAMGREKGWALDWLRAGAQGGGPWGASLLRGSVTLLVWLTPWAGKGELGRFLASTAPVKTDHPALLWTTFLSIALSLTCETFVRALSDDMPNLHSFNLLSFSFLLHVQSSIPPKASATSTPAAELYLYLLLTLLELLTLQLSYCLPFLVPSFISSRNPARPRRSATTRSYRLAITAFFSLVAQFFAIRAWMCVFGPSFALNGEDDAPVPEGSGELHVVFMPGMFWWNKLPEVAFELVVGVSVGLKALAALIRGEPMTLDNLVGHPQMAPSAEEDYAVALIKYATHLLSSTRLSGLAYELSPIEVLPPSISSSLDMIGLLPLGPPDTQRHHSSSGEDEGGMRVVLARNGDVLLVEEIEADSAAPSGLRRRRGPRPEDVEPLSYGFSTEVRQVEVEVGGGAGGGIFEGGEDGAWEGEWGSGFREEVEYERRIGMAQIQGERKGVMWRFVAILFRIAFYLLYSSLVRLRSLGRKILRLTGWRADAGVLDDTWSAQQNPVREERRRAGRARSAAPEEVQDDEDDGEWLPSEDEEDEASSVSSSRSASPDLSAAPAFQPSDYEEDDPTSNALALFSDLSHPPSSSPAHSAPYTPEDLAPYLLAHHLSSASTPVTRRRYRSLLPSPFPPSPQEDRGFAALSSAISSRRSDLGFAQPRSREEAEQWNAELEKKREEWREGRSAFCVVCTVEPRSVVLWPCRCLALCEPCRAALAERTTTSSTGGGGGFGGEGAGDGGNLCPTCRSPVAGFSRIFIP